MLIKVFFVIGYLPFTCYFPGILMFLIASYQDFDVISKSDWIFMLFLSKRTEIKLEISDYRKIRTKEISFIYYKYH